MGLKMTLKKEMNHMYVDFIDAYWCLENIGYDTTQVGTLLNCYPTRESKTNNRMPLTEHLNIGSPVKDAVDSILYSWQALFPIVTVFPQGIPLNENEQKRILYNFIKEYTGLPFEDVIED